MDPLRGTSGRSVPLSERQIFRGFYCWINLSNAVSSPPGPPGYRWRDYGALTIIMVGIAFGFHQLYKVQQHSWLISFTLNVSLKCVQCIIFCILRSVSTDSPEYCIYIGGIGGLNYGARIEGASAICNIALILLKLPCFTSKHDLIWTPSS